MFLRQAPTPTLLPLLEISFIFIVCWEKFITILALFSPALEHPTDMLKSALIFQITLIYALPIKMIYRALGGTVFERIQRSFHELNLYVGVLRHMHEVEKKR